jgi:hypothetical protein
MSEINWTSAGHSQLWAFVNNMFTTVIFLLLPMALQPISWSWLLPLSSSSHHFGLQLHANFWY